MQKQLGYEHKIVNRESNKKGEGDTTATKIVGTSNWSPTFIQKEYRKAENNTPPNDMGEEFCVFDGCMRVLFHHNKDITLFVSYCLNRI